MSRKKQNIAYVKPEEPAFLKRIKEQIGYKEGPTVDTKREAPAIENGEDDDAERDDEKPQVVVLKPGDIDEEELAQITKEQADEDDRNKVAEGKITFIKAAKRRASTDGQESSSTVASTKKAKAVNEAANKPKVTSKAVSESRLLSFDVPDDADD